MNILHIQDETINLIGFSKLSEKAYFTFRSNGLVISGEHMDIENEQHEYSISQNSITDKELSKHLIECGFLNFHSFSEHNGMYICKFPV